MNIQPVNLVGKFVQLEPLTESHRSVFAVLTQDETIWTYYPYTALGDNFDPWFDKTLAKMESGEQVVFAARRLSDGKIIGSTRYYDINSQHRRLMIGHTWYTQEARGTQVNPECKLLLLVHAFESLNINRVEFATDARNLISQAAIKKLGATQEGVLRQHMVLDNGFVRDTVLFSIIKSEWLTIKHTLQARVYS
jgi:RimJ/RimL family protein N-acetyltransferase